MRGIAAALLGGLALGCASSGPDQGAAAVETEKAALIRIDTEFSKMAQERGLAEAFATYAAPDATMMPMNQNPVLGRELIRGQFADMPQETKLLWKPFAADVAKSGDLGYTLGTYELHTREADGRPVTRYGKYCSVWRKQADGTWKWVVDIGNASPEPKDAERIKR